MADLITSAEYKASVGVDPTDDRKDAEIAALIPAASQVIRMYTERDFGAPTVTETRTFEYDGSGFLDIDDASVLTQVSFKVPSAPDIVLDADSWYGAPSRRDDSPVFYYIIIGGTMYGLSPEMGFKSNLDVLWSEGRWPFVSRTAQVTGTWGWPDIPSDVKLAAIWTIQDWLTKPSGEGMTAEAIAGYSRAWGAKTGTGPSPSLAIPNKARDILASYQKQSV